MFWFATVQSAFQIKVSSIFPVLWQIMAILDIVINVNTTKLEDGKEIKNRMGILIIYIKSELVVDLLCVVCIIVQSAIPAH